MSNQNAEYSQKRQLKSKIKKKTCRHSLTLPCGKVGTLELFFLHLFCQSHLYQNFICYIRLHFLLEHDLYSIIKRNKVMESIPCSKYQSAPITKYTRFMFQFLNWKLERQTEKEKETERGCLCVCVSKRKEARIQWRLLKFSQQIIFCNFILCQSYFSSASWIQIFIHVFIQASNRTQSTFQ